MKEVGYIQLGHSCKGKQRWIVSEKEMYKDHKGAKEILLWCYSKDNNHVTPLRKCLQVSASSASSSAPKTSQAESIAQNSLKLMKLPVNCLKSTLIYTQLNK